MQPNTDTATEPFVISRDPIDIEPHLDVEPTSTGGISVTPEVYVSHKTLAKYGDQLIRRAVAESSHTVLDEIARKDAKRQAIEDKRANHRNFNRVLMLVCTLLIGLIVTYMLTNHGMPGLFVLPKWTFALAPYSFVITVMMDTSLTVYAYVKRY